MNKISSIAPNSKVRPQISLECSNSSIKGSGANQEDSHVKKKCTYGLYIDYYVDIKSQTKFCFFIGTLLTTNHFIIPA